MKTHVRYVVEHLDQLLDFIKRLRNSRFRRQLLRRKKIDEITNCLAVAGKDTVVYVGDYGNDNQDGRLKGGSSSGPVQGITRCLGHKCTVVVTDKLRTSMICHRCHHLLEQQEDVLYDQAGNAVARRPNRRSLHCPFCARKGHPHPPMAVTSTPATTSGNGAWKGTAKLDPCRFPFNGHAVGASFSS